MNKPALSPRFLSKIKEDPVTGCWNWTAYIYPTGYGSFRITGYAHRYAYSVVNGPLINGMTIDHLCRNRKCCNPAHLEQVSQRTNLLRGSTTMASIRAAKTHCPQGHPYSGENLLLIKASGRWEKRTCRTCNKISCAKRYATKRVQDTDQD